MAAVGNPVSPLRVGVRLSAPETHHRKAARGSQSPEAAVRQRVLPAHCCRSTQRDR